MRSARSLGFFKPANTILVPGMYFLGFSKYSKRVSSPHEIPLDLLASEYEKPAAWPVLRPQKPCRLGPTLCLPPASTVWHWAHLWTKIFLPFSAFPAGIPMVDFCVK
ncbi:unnamed protein product [Spodoptera exigua]|nr:unnamed protein product [Spodoptera exigua]